MRFVVGFVLLVVVVFGGPSLVSPWLMAVNVVALPILYVLLWRRYHARVFGAELVPARDGIARELGDDHLVVGDPPTQEVAGRRDLRPGQ